MWKRVALALALLVAFIYAWRSLDRVAIEVVGQPAETGPIQYKLEQPFFEQLAQITGLALDVQYRTTDTLGIRDDHQLRLVKDGALQLVSLRFLQNASAEPSLLGVDLPGLVTDYAVARAVVEAYAPVLDQRLREGFNAKLLGIWPFGPQTFFCRSGITGLRDIAGRKIRVGNVNFSPMISSLGGTAVVIPFDDVKEALRSGLVDCAITSATSGNFARWTEHTSHYFPLGMQMGLNGYVVSLKLWNTFTPSQQQALETAFRKHIDNIWTYSASEDKDASSCIVDGPCRSGRRRQLTLVTPAEEDYRLMGGIAYKTTFDDWARRCDAIHPGCSADWLQRVGPVLQTVHGASPVITEPSK